MLKNFTTRYQRYKVDFNEFASTVFNRYFVIYLIKCLFGAAICFWLYATFPGHQYYWALVSVILVIAPEDRDSIKFSLDRIEANIIGATIGLLYYILAGISIVTLLLAILTTILFCTAVRLGNSTRTALAALIIVMVLENEKNNWHIALDRMLSVMVGCLIAILITGITYWIKKPIMESSSDEATE
ncbi:MAG: aromatic acid exporter family protein [Ignavibacteria bacterium]|nr:aromatic acid exporter family protein [Ignavibacteria bacterium]